MIASKKPCRTAGKITWLRFLGLSLVCFLAAACANSEAVKPNAIRAAERSDMWQATVVVENGAGHGSGVIVGNGSVLTAYHVVDDGIPEIEFFGGERVSGVVDWASEALDLAIVRVDIPDRYAAPALFCGTVTPDQRLVSIGHPLSTRWVLVEGYLNKMDISDKTHLLPLGFDLSLGNSGGPVFDDSGRIVGIAEAILVTRTVQQTAAGEKAGHGDYLTGTGLMLPASMFCDEIRGW